MKKTVVLLTIAALFLAPAAFAAEITDLMPELKQAKRDISATLSEIGRDLKAAALQLSGMDLKSDAARAVLNGLRKFRPYVVDCSIVDPDGVKIVVEPQDYKSLESMDRSSLPSVIKLLKEKKPVLSDVYHSSEGVSAVSVGYLILSTTGEVLGAVRMLIRHEQFLKPMTENRPFSIWIMQSNGLIIYDPDPEEIGLNIFTDPMYEPFKDLVSFAKTVALNTSGAGSYKFYAKGAKDKTVVDKIAVWDTVGLYDNQWRVIVMEVEPETDPQVANGAAGAETQVGKK